MPLSLHTLLASNLGSPKRQMKLYDIVVAAFTPVAIRITGNPCDAEEVIHDVLLGVFNRYFAGTLPAFASDVAAMAWLKRCVVNRAIDSVRAKMPQEMFVPFDEQLAMPASDYDEELPEGISVENVAAAIGRLPAFARTVVSLFLIEGFDYEEISQILHVPQSTLRVQYHRSRKKLASYLCQKR